MIAQTIESLNSQFNKRYNKVFLELNQNVTLAAKETDTFEVPSATVGGGGGSIVVGGAETQINPPAKVSINYSRKQAVKAIYRIAVPISECTIAEENPEYFNYLFDQIMGKAIANYNATFGGQNTMRFGESYCEFKSFLDLGGDELILELMGTWASNQDTPAPELAKTEEA